MWDRARREKMFEKKMAQMTNAFVSMTPADSNRVLPF
jgi:hypothetical protein